jgi:hypothetical protein
MIDAMTEYVAITSLVTAAQVLSGFQWQSLSVNSFWSKPVSKYFERIGFEESNRVADFGTYFLVIIKAEAHYRPKNYNSP